MKLLIIFLAFALGSTALADPVEQVRYREIAGSDSNEAPSDEVKALLDGEDNCAEL